jgi:toxin YoeB
MFKIEYEKKALKQLKKLKNNQQLLDKISSILYEISLDPYSPSHKFERLKGNLSGFCSKRIDKQNRLVYQVQDQKVIVVVISVLGHYE